MKRENSTKKFDVGSKADTERDKEFREKPSVNWNKGRDALRVRPFLVKLSTWEKKRTKGFKKQKTKTKKKTKQKNHSKLLHM